MLTVNSKELWQGKGKTKANNQNDNKNWTHFKGEKQRQQKVN